MSRVGRVVDDAIGEARGLHRRIGVKLQLAYMLAAAMREKPQHVFTESEILEAIRKWRKSVGYRGASALTRGTASRAVADVRDVLEKEHHTSLHTLRSIGWRIAKPEELSVLALRHVRKIIVNARRSHQLLKIAPPEHIPAALKQVFEREKGLIETVAEDRGGFLQKLMSYQATAGALTALPKNGGR